MPGRSKGKLQDYEMRRIGSVVEYPGTIKTGSMKKLAVDWAGSDSPNVGYYRPRWTSPLLSWTNYYIPWDRATLYQWIRFYDTFHPLVGNAIDLHTQMPLSRFGLKNVKDKIMLNFYEETLEQMDAYLLMYDQMREYWLIGEAITYLNWDDNLGTFTDGEILMPEYVEVRGHPFITGDKEESSYSFYLTPDDAIVQFIKSNDPVLQKLKNRIPKEVIEAVNTGKDIQISEFNLMTMFRKQSRYNPRGTSIILRCLKDLLYEDKLREAQYAIADRHVLPKEIWKLGNEKISPTGAKLKAFREMIKTAEDQPKFTLVTHYAVNYEVVGATGHFPNLANEFDWVENRILTALFTNKALTHGEGPTFANASVATRAMLMRYIPVRSMLEDNWKTKVFTPIALKHEFFETTEAEISHRVRKSNKDRKLIIPDFDWRYKSNLLDDSAVRDMIKSLVVDGKFPMKLLTDMMGIDYDYIKDWIKKEEGDVFDPTYKETKRALQSKGLNAARTASKGEDKKSKEQEEAEENEEKEREGKILPKEFSFLSRGGIKRKIRAAERLLKDQKVDVIKLLIGGKDNIVSITPKKK